MDTVEFQAVVDDAAKEVETKVIDTTVSLTKKMLSENLERALKKLGLDYDSTKLQDEQ